MTFIARALSLLEASVYSIISNTRTVIIIILSAIFLGDEITLTIAAGGLVVMFGASLIVYEKGQHIRLGKGEVYALLAALTLAIPLVSDFFALQDDYDPASYLAMIWIMPGILLSVARRPEAMKIKEYARDKMFWFRVAAPAAMLSLAVITIMTAFQDANNPSVLAIVSQSSSVTVVLASILFLGERKNIQLKLVASVIAFGGLVLANL
jgi:EamA-like transporter family.